MNGRQRGSATLGGAPRAKENPRVEVWAQWYLLVLDEDGLLKSPRDSSERSLRARADALL